MKIFPRAWAHRHLEFEVVPTPDSDAVCTSCAQPFLKTDLGVLIPHVDERGVVVELPWHRTCLLTTIGAKDM